MVTELDLASLTAEDMVPSVGTTFVASMEGEVVDHMVLAAVEPGRPSSGGRTPFSLTFVGAAGTGLPQAVYDLESSSGVRVSIFLVPSGESSDGRRFEAVFN